MTPKTFLLAAMADKDKIRYQLTPRAVIHSIDDVKLYEGKRIVTLTKISTLGKSAESGYITAAEELDVTKNYRISIEGYGEIEVIPSDIFDSDYFAENYHYDGDDLGAVTDGHSTTFKLWAPTASRVLLNLFYSGDGGKPYTAVEMLRGDKGVWSYTATCGHGTYYTYTVTTSIGAQETADPYARAAGVNGNRSMVVDLSLTNPDGWESHSFSSEIQSYSDAIIWEVHVRDFSNKIAKSKYKGKYLAFTECGLVNEHGQPVGVDYLVSLGITHVHLLPVFDYASVDESNPDADFNWGYDPKSYNLPEGSYSTDPYRGEVRIKEYKRMVMALHEAGIGVIMDVVYNHTYDTNSSFNKTVPYYYYRYTPSGKIASASGCGNDTAPERYMYSRFMVESAAYWMREYKLDGLRFDLMGLCDLETIQKIERSVHTVNPKAIIYGEGWTMGSTIDGRAQANQKNIKNIIKSSSAVGGVAVFNDVIRDGLKGSVFNKKSRGYVSGDADNRLPDVTFGITGSPFIDGEPTSRYGWGVRDAAVINYMSAHDNHTLWDKLCLSCPTDSEEVLSRMNRLGAAIVMISRGTPFWQAGEEMHRTKGGDANSYKSGDATNNIDWSVLKEGKREYQTMLYYRGLIEMRKRFNIFRDSSNAVARTGTDTCPRVSYGNGSVITCRLEDNRVLTVLFDDARGGRALAVINPHKASLSYLLEGEWNLVANEERAGYKVISRESGSVTLSGISIKIYVNDALLDEK